MAEETHDMRHVCTLFVCLSLLTISVIFAVLLPPLNDYPNHLARMHILAGLDHSELLRRYYRNVMEAQPNLAMDLIVPLLAKAMPLELAGKLFIAAIIELSAAGVYLLHRVVHGRWSVWPALAFLFAFHRMLLWGLLNFCFGLGMALCALALWLYLRERPLWLRIAGSIVGAAAVYICHLYAMGVYVLAIAGVEAWHLFAPSERRYTLADFAATVAQFLLPACFFFFFSGTPASATETKWGSIWRKFEAPFDVIYQYHLAFDVACLLALAALVAWGFWRKRIVIAPQLVPAVALVFLAFLAMPDELFSGYGADRRMPIAVLWLTIAALDWHPRRAWWREPVALAVIAVTILRLGLLAQVWLESDKVYRQYYAEIERLPSGARIMPLTFHPYEQSLIPIPLLHGACLAIVLRDALVPNLFTTPPFSSESVSLTPDAEKLRVASGLNEFLPSDIERLNAHSGLKAKLLLRRPVVSRFDYVFITRPDVLPPGSIPAALQETARTPYFAIYKVRR